MERNISVGDAREGAAAYAPERRGKAAAGKQADGLCLRDVWPKDANGGFTHRLVQCRRLPEIDPQCDYGREKHSRERKVESVFCLRLSLQVQRGSAYRVDLVIDGGKGQPSEFLAVRSRIPHAHADQNQGADDKHKDDVVEKVNVHEPAHGTGLVMARFVENLKHKAHRAKHEARQQGADGALTIHARPEYAEDEADGDG